MSDITRRDAVKVAALGATALGATAAVAADQDEAKQIEGQQERGVASRARGSSKMIEAMLGEKVGLNPDELRKMVRLLDRDGVQIVDWCQYGQPVIDGVCGKLHVRPKGVGALIEQIAVSRLRPNLDVFPIGLLNPDALQIVIRIGRVPGH